MYLRSILCSLGFSSNVHAFILLNKVEVILNIFFLPLLLVSTIQNVTINIDLFSKLFSPNCPLPFANSLT